MNRLLKVMLIICFSVLFSVNNLYSQETWEELVAQLADEDESGQWKSHLEELAELYENPININTATKEQLEQIPFLSDRLIENILYYVYKYGSMLTENELLMVEDMDRQTMHSILPFICFKVPEKKEDKLDLKRVLKYGKQELSTRVDIPLYIKEGYKIHSPEVLEKNPNKQYLGYGYYHNLRYSFRYKDRVYVGVTAEKDAGEPFFSGQNKKGYDFYSPYLFIRKVGRINALAIGNYRLSYGFGLVMNTDFGMGKTATLSTLGSRAKGIKKHSSTDEYNYFQGVAASYKLSKRWILDGFYSYRKMDGIVDNRFIRSIKKDGYHRLVRDFEKKNVLSNQVAGSNLTYDGKFCELGITAVYNVFNKPLNPEQKYYNTYYPRGRHFYNIGGNYKFFWKRFSWWGETAVDKCGAIATVNLLSYSPKTKTRLMVMNRYYDKQYQSLYARSVSEGSMIQNEEGLYIGLETNVLKYVRLTCYGDFFRFPWKRYLVNKSGTQGMDGLIQFSYSPTYQLEMFIRYRYKKKEKDLTGENKQKHTIPYMQHKCRYQLNYTLKDKLMLKTILDYVRVGYRGQSASDGFLVSQSLSYKPASWPVQIDVSGTWFNTDGYDARITLYEKSVLYAFSMPSFYDRGTRIAINLRYELSRNIILQAKYADTRYLNRDKISSALEQINGNRKNDLYFQLRLKF